MITPTQMYWLVKLDDMRHALRSIAALPISLVIVLVILMAIVFVQHADEDSDTKAKVLNDLRRGVVWCLSMLLVVVALDVFRSFIPSTRQMAAIIVVPKIANSEKIQIAGNKLYEIAVEWMDELRPNKGEEGTK